ncbi:MAG TPA: hypothetical protein ENI11_06515 [Actinobacteria bacterium]|nr:hypothetical protein [Actinomycetota bacterium]
MSDLKHQAFRHIEIFFGQPVSSEEFIGLAGVKDVTAQDAMLRCTVSGSLDAVIKKAAKFEVINVISEEPNLEDIFLTYYGGDDVT